MNYSAAYTFFMFGLQRKTTVKIFFFVFNPQKRGALFVRLLGLVLQCKLVNLSKIYNLAHFYNQTNILIIIKVSPIIYSLIHLTLMFARILSGLRKSFCRLISAGLIDQYLIFQIKFAHKRVVIPALSFLLLPINLLLLYLS